MKQINNRQNKTIMAKKKRIVKPIKKSKVVVKPKKQVKKICTTCSGFGLWGFGDASPMGPMDASDGYPTLACPECGANKNPIED